MDDDRKACYLLTMVLVVSFGIAMPHSIPLKVARDIASAVPINSVSAHIRHKRQAGDARAGMDAILGDAEKYKQAQSRFMGQIKSTKIGKELSAKYDKLYGGARDAPITKPHFIALSRYTKDKGYFVEVNARLRAGRFTDEDVVLQNLLYVSPKVGGNTKLVRFEEEWPGSEAFYKANGVSVFESFLSTSMNPDFDIHSVPGSADWERYYRLEITHIRSGVEVNKLIKPTLDWFQQEVLFPAGSRFNVRSVSNWQTDSTGTFKVIKLEE